jgi:predicted O-methyltransferase YrrM
MRRMPDLPSRLPRALVVVLACLPAVLSGCTSEPGAAASPEARTANIRPDITPQIQTVLDGIRAADAGQLAISEEDGRFLRLLVVSSGARRALEIGGASGYSAIWLGLGLRETGGTLVTIEYDPDRARQLQTNVAAAGLDDVVTVMAGDAVDVIPGIDGTFDLIFLDAWKPDYLRFFEMTLPRLEAGGLFLAHNVVNKRDEMPDFLAAIDTHPDLLTAIVSPGDEGVSVSVKR